MQMLMRAVMPPSMLAWRSSYAAHWSIHVTVNPPEKAARFLGGGQPVTIVNPGWAAQKWICAYD